MTKYIHTDPEFLTREGLRAIGVKVPTPEDDVHVFKKFLEQNPHLKEDLPSYHGEERRLRRNEFYPGPERRERIRGKEKPD